MLALTVHATLLTVGIFRFDVDLHVEVLDLIYLYRVTLALVGPFLGVDVGVEANFVSFLKELVVLVMVEMLLQRIFTFISLSNRSWYQIALLVVVLLLSRILHVCVVELGLNQTSIWSTHCQ